MAAGGYQNRMIRVDLTSGKITTEPGPDDAILRKYVGGSGLGLWYLMHELPAGTAPLDPENPMIFTTGPLTGLKEAVPCRNNTTLSTFNEDTKFTYGRAHTHGWFGPFMRMAGYDGLIITGASPTWVYLWINDDKIELRDASALLGKDTHETEDLVKEELGFPVRCGGRGNVSVAAIGPAGENVVGGAFIESDKNHSFAHSGVGRIMGSKRLKAIAVRGTGDVPVFDHDKLAPLAVAWNKAAATDSGRGEMETTTAAKYGGTKGGAVERSNFESIRERVGVATRNFQSSDLPGFGDGWNTGEITPRPCFGCPIHCCCDVLITQGKYKGHLCTLSGGGESIEGAASSVGCGASGDPGEALYLIDLIDRLGFESSTVGCAMAVAFEAYEKGLLTTKETDGLELKWGDAEVVAELLRRIAHREGSFAIMLGDGPLTAAQRVGLPNAGVHIKGGGMNLHDWRRAFGALLGMIVSGGASWHSPGVDCWGPEADAGYPVMTEMLSPFNKGQEVAATAPLKHWGDSNGTCWFAIWNLPGSLTYSSGCVAAATGWEDFDAEEARAVGHRVVTLERIFNIAHGLTVDDDIHPSLRLLEPAPADAGPAAGKTIAPYLEGWVRDYYEHLGWDRRSGKPWMSTLKKLGLDEFAGRVWG
jgi:aldehyde:ferredoxin oxidoreductase